MEAVVTLKLTPGELDTIRTALDDSAEKNRITVARSDESAPDRAKARTAEFKARELLGRLRA